jgi:hypothetical protein
MGEGEGGERKGGGACGKKLILKPQAELLRGSVCVWWRCYPVVSPKISHTKWTKQHGRASLPDIWRGLITARGSCLQWRNFGEGDRSKGAKVVVKNLTGNS